VTDDDPEQKIVFGSGQGLVAVLRITTAALAVTILLRTCS
jgi:hypothetical protein